MVARAGSPRRLQTILSNYFALKILFRTNHKRKQTRRSTVVPERGMMGARCFHASL
jgi:hypothetical protein